MKRNIFLVIFFLAVLNEAVFAIYPTVRNYSRKVSKAGTQNWDIIQHGNGWMYFANNQGLLEFDGNRWTTYPIRNYTNVRSLLYDEHLERIYAGAFNEFGYYARNEAGLLQYYSLIEQVKEDERNFNEIWNISQIENTIYFQGDKEIFVYKGNNISRFSFQHKIDCSSVVQNLFLVSTTQDGVFCLNGNLFLRLPNAEILKDKKICAILPYEENRILFVTDFYGLYVFDGEKVERFKTDIDNFLFENQIFCASIKGTKLALGTVMNGLIVKDLHTNENVFSNTSSGLQNNTILSISFDEQDNIWLGLDKGIDYVLINSPIYDLFGNSQLFGAGYCSLIKDNILYLGTNQGLYTTSYPIQNTPDLIPVKLMNKMQGQVWSLAFIDKTIFCGTDHGAFIIEGNTARQIPNIQGTWNFRELKHNPGYILGCSYQGFFLLKKTGDSWQLRNFIKGFEDSGGMFEEDNNGDIWFSHWMKGISRLTLNENLDSIISIEHYDSSKGFVSNQNNTIFRVKNKIVFSTTNGFYTYNHKSSEIERDVELENLFGVPPHSIKLSETPKGDIWCTSHSFFWVAFIQPDKEYQLDSLSFNSLKDKIISGFEHLYFINDTIVLASTEDGFSYLDVSKREIQNSIFNVSIRNIYLSKNKDSAIRGYQSRQENETIPEFNFKQNSIQFEYIAPEYRHEEYVTYSYILEGYDSEWSAYSSVNTKEYAKLKKGTYTFKVRAKSELERNPVETSYQFVILPPWYESNVAYVIYFLLFILLAFISLLLIKKHSEKGIIKMKVQKELEMQEQEKRFMADTKEKEKEIIALKNQRLQYELRHKSQELASSTMNLIRKNEILFEITNSLGKIVSDIKNDQNQSTILSRINKMEKSIHQNIETDNNWKKFQENFDLVYENYLKRLGESYPILTVGDKKLCAYLKMGLSSKDIAPLLNMSVRSVEMSRYRLRKKLNLDKDANLTAFLQQF